MEWITLGVMIIVFITMFGSWVNYLPVFKEVAQEMKVPVVDLYALVWIESNFNPNAKNGEAIGLMQITPHALEEVNKRLGTNYSVEDLYDPYINLRVGAAYYARLREFFSFYFDAYTADVMAAVAYNWGIGNVLKILNSDLSPEMIVAKVPTETAYFAMKFLLIRNYLMYGEGKHLLKEVER